MRKLLRNDITAVPIFNTRRRCVTVAQSRRKYEKGLPHDTPFLIGRFPSASVILTNRRARWTTLRYRVAGQRTQNQHKRRGRANLDYVGKQVCVICSFSTQRPFTQRCIAWYKSSRRFFCTKCVKFIKEQRLFNAHCVWLCLCLRCDCACTHRLAVNGVVLEI